MKSIRDIVLIVLTGLLLASCSEVSELMGIDRRIRLSQQVTTRAAQNLNNGYIAEGDRIRVKITPSVTGVTTDYSFTAIAGGILESTPGETVAYYPETGTIDIAAWTPWSVNGETFSVAADQTAGVDYKQSDLLFASVLERSYEGGIIPLEFRHQMAKLNVNVTLEPGITAVTAVTLKNVRRSVMLDALTGNIQTLVDDEHQADDINMSGNGAAVFPPQTLTGVFLEIATPEGTARFAVDGQPFVANGEYTLTVYLSAAALGETTLVNAWDGSDQEVGSGDDGSSGLTIGDIEGDPFLWTGNDIEPTPVVKCNGTPLVKDRDYKLAYFDNNAAGLATIVAKGIGAVYDGMATAKTFHISHSDNGVITFTDESPTQTLSPRTEDNWFTQGLTNNGDGRVTYTLSENTCGATIDADAVVWFTKAGHVTVTATVEDGVSCSYSEKKKSYLLTVVQGEAEISFNETNVERSFSTTAAENSHTQEVVNNGDGVVGYTLSDNTCGASIKGATVTFSKAGSVTVTATVNDTPNFHYDMKTASYVLTVSGLAGDLTVSVSPTDYTYDGTKKTPTVTVKYGDKTLTKDTDYTLSGDLSAINVGIYAITATGKGGYSGTGTAQWNITKQTGALTVTVSPATYAYDGSQKTPTVTVKYGTKTLTKDVDYTLSGNLSATSVGTYTITATGKGGYSGTGSAQWSIYTLSGALTVSVSPTAYAYNGSQKTPTVTVKYGTKTLTKDIDYTLSGDLSATNVGTYTITATGKGGYSGTGSANWNINQANGYVTLSATSGSVNTGNSTTFTISSSHGGALSVSSNNTSRATATLNGSTVTVATSGTTAATVTITVTCAATTNYKAATATYTLSIQTPPMTLALLKAMVNNGGNYNGYLGWYVNAAGEIRQNHTSGDIGKIAYISVGDVDEAMAGSRILVAALEDIGSYQFATNSNIVEYTSYTGAIGLKFCSTHANSTYPAANAAYNWSKARPAGASRWFIPSQSQFNAMFGRIAGYKNNDYGSIWDSYPRWGAHLYGSTAYTFTIMNGPTTYGVRNSQAIKSESLRVRACFAY